MITLRSLFIYCLLISGSISYAYTPGQRGAIQDLTKAIVEGNISEPEARKKAVSFKIKDKDLRDEIVNELIITADREGIQDIANPAMVNEITESSFADEKRKQLTKPTAPVSVPAKPRPAAQPTGREKAAPLLIQLKQEYKKLESTQTGKSLTQNAKTELREQLDDLLKKYSNIAVQFSKNYTYSPQEITLQKEIEELHTILSNIAGSARLLYEAPKPAEKPAPTQPTTEKPVPVQVKDKAKYKTSLETLIDGINFKIKALENVPDMLGKATYNAERFTTSENEVNSSVKALNKQIDSDTTYKLNKDEQALRTELNTKYDRVIILLKQMKALIDLSLKFKINKAEFEEVLAEIKKLIQKPSEITDKAFEAINEKIKQASKNNAEALSNLEQAIKNKKYSEEGIAAIKALNTEIKTLVQQLNQEKNILDAEKALATPAKPQPTTEKPAPAAAQPAIDKSELQKLEQDFKSNKAEHEAILVNIQNLIQKPSEVTDKAIDDENEKIKKASANNDKALRSLITAENNKKYSKEEIDAIKALEKEIETLYKKIKQARDSLTGIYLENKEKAKQTPTTPAGTPPSVATTKPAEIPTDIQALINEYKNKTFTEDEFTALMRNARIGESGMVDVPYAQALELYQQKTDAQVKEDMKKELFAHATASWNPKRIAFIYLRLLETKHFLKKHPKLSLTDADADAVLQEFLLKEQNGTSFVKVLEAWKDTVLNPSAIKFTKPDATRFGGTAQSTLPSLVDTYLNKQYKSAADIDKYNKALNRTVVRMPFGNQDNASVVTDAIKTRIKQAKNEYSSGAPSEQRITEILLPAYYDVKDMITVDFSGKSGFKAAEAEAKNALKQFLSYNPVTGQNLASYIDQFEKDVDSGKIPTTTPTIVMTTTTQPTTTTNPNVPADLQQLAENINGPVNKEIEALKKVFAQPATFQALKSDNKDAKISLYYLHIFGLDFSASTNTKIDLKGFHHDYNKQVEDGGIIQFNIERGPNKSGCYSAVLSYDSKVFASKNFFPSNWTRAEVVSKIREAYDNKELITKKAEGTYEIKGQTTEGIDILMRVNNKGLIFTAHPEKI